MLEMHYWTRKKMALFSSNKKKIIGMMNVCVPSETLLFEFLATGGKKKLIPTIRTNLLEFVLLRRLHFYLLSRHCQVFSYHFSSRKVYMRVCYWYLPPPHLGNTRHHSTPFHSRYIWLDMCAYTILYLFLRAYAHYKNSQSTSLFFFPAFHCWKFSDLGTPVLMEINPALSISVRLRASKQTSRGKEMQ